LYKATPQRAGSMTDKVKKGLKNNIYSGYEDQTARCYKCRR